MSINVASIYYGHSDFHDDVWAWIGEHHHHLSLVGFSSLDPWDAIGAWGILALAGCKIESRGFEDCPAEYRTSYGEEVVITFDGDIDELIARLNDIIE